MSRIENVKVGDHLIVIANDYRKEQVIPVGFEYEHKTAIRAIDPEPLTVVAISTPVILCKRVSGDSSTFFIDCRFSQWSKVGADYVREYCKLEGIEPPDEVKNDKEIEDQKEEKKKRCCPLCLERMRERRGGLTGPRWFLFCEFCEMAYVPLGTKFV